MIITIIMMTMIKVLIPAWSRLTEADSAMGWISVQQVWTLVAYIRFFVPYYFFFKCCPFLFGCFFRVLYISYPFCLVGNPFFFFFARRGNLH